MLELGINNVNNAEYHGDVEYLSSSSLKLVLKDSQAYYDQYILGNKVNEQKNAFDEGSLVHAHILEPEVIEQEFAFYPGFRKAGKEFKAFKLQNPDKIIISESQRLKCENYFNAYKQRPEAVQLISGGFSEHTICAELLGVPVKIRTDYINPEQGYIVDIKTTRMAADIESFKETTLRYGYDLSAALYMKVASAYYNKDFDFYFAVISKQDAECEVFKLSNKTHDQGLNKVMKALNRYKECKEKNNWKNPESFVIKETKDYEILEV